MRARLKDVAERAGVSIKTVSNVVNGHPHVSAATRERVQAAIAELSYRPNLSARNLRSGRSGVVALAVPDLDNPYFAELATHVISAAGQRGWTVLVDQTQGDPDKERLVVGGSRSHLIDGLLFSPLALAQRAPSAATARLRLKGYRQALAACGLAADPSLIAHAPAWHRTGGAEAMAALLGADAPDAVFCFNDALALGALRTLLSRGYRVPQDVMVMGFDDIEDGRFATPSLSTVSPGKALIAESAVSLLADRLAGATGEPREVRVPHRLTPRESSLSGAFP
ncbi:LacI family DNA-binding transcriptional regulator [Nonomuraea sp. KM88]|uniref:LacI family DNA-binding transcriptional regulator n=1 Tax=Nonomuraea sp. KM88 TaxID=3457427 RepID=UPI003FCD11BA